MRELLLMIVCPRESASDLCKLFFGCFVSLGSARLRGTLSYRMSDGPSPAAIYYNEIGRTPVIRDATEERRLIRLWQQNKDFKARDAVIQSHLKFVVRQAHKRTKDPVAVQDYIAVGNLGLLKAIDRFDCERKPPIKFLTYAGWWVHKEMSDHDYATSSLVHVPTHRQKEYRRAARAKRAAEAAGTHLPDTDAFIGTVPYCDGSALESVDDDELSKNGAESAAETASADERREAVERILEELPNKEALVLKLFFGFRGEARTLTQIAQLTCLTPEEVRQTKMRGLKLLRETLSERDAEELLGEAFRA
jgi:RNA polymerase sigma factor (sigma-70 family)